MAGYAEFDQVWLVRSAGLVLGPFSMNELAEALRERRVSILDEVRTPQSRWNFVREYKDLQPLVKEIRDHEVKDKTDTAIELETEVTRPNWNVEAANLKTPRITVVDEVTPIPEHLQGHVEKSPAPREKAKENRTKASMPPAKVPRPLSPPEIPREQPAGKPWVWAFAIGVFLAAIVVGGLFLLGGGSANVEKMQTSELYSMAKLAKDRGRWDHALDLFHRAQPSPAPKIEAELEFVPLLLLSGHDQSLIHSILGRAPANWDPSHMTLWKALLQMQESQFAAAQKSLSDLLDRSTTDNHARLNRLINSFYLDDAPTLLRDFQQLQQAGEQNPLVLIVPAMQRLKKMAQERDSRADASVVNLIQQLQSRAVGQDSYRYEFVLLAGLLQSKLGLRGLEDSIATLLDLDPLGSRTEWPEPEVDAQLLDSSRWVSLCDELVDSPVTELQKSVLKVQCQILSGQLPAASQSLTQMVQTLGPQPLLRRWKAYVEAKSGLWAEAREDAGVDRGQISRQVVSKVCLEQKDVDCAEKAMLDWFGNRGVYVEQMTKLNILKNKKDIAQHFLHAGMKDHPRYKAFWDLEEEISGAP